MLNSQAAGSGLSSTFATGQHYSDLGFSQFTAESDSYAISNFSFSPDGTANFSAAAVPEPRTWLLLLVGGLTVA